MSDGNDVAKSLVKAAAALTGRTLSTAEQNKVVEDFNKATGTNERRAAAALSKISGQSERLILEKSAASDDANRAFLDLLDVMKEWDE